MRKIKFYLGKARGEHAIRLALLRDSRGCAPIDELLLRLAARPDYARAGGKLLRSSDQVRTWESIGA